MNIIDLVCALVLVFAVLGGIYRGFLSSVLNFLSTLISIFLSRALMILPASLIKSGGDFYNMLLYYTEGSEYVAKTAVEMVRTSIENVGPTELNAIIDRADMPVPMGSRILHNIAVEAFADTGYTTIGDYFNLTIVAVVINIGCFALCFVILRVILGLLQRSLEYGRNGFPLLSGFDSLTAAGVGLLHGVLLLYTLFLVVPVILTVLPSLYVFISESFFGEFFYRVNPLLSLIPGV